MAKINLLEEQIYNRIAAGEVVENPRSVVKELVENSIDAGATSITVEITGGGIDYIRVTDNGEGMSKSDILKSVLSHATSKVGCLDDLNHISTLGFRGEALPSIGSVSSLTIMSRERGSELGFFVKYNFGKKSDEGECGAAEGTSVIVENLFEKIPARKKFLKKPAYEAIEVSNLILRLIISNYNISIKFISDEKTIYHSDGKGLQSAIYAVYGKQLSADLVFFEQTMPDITLYGFVGKPGLSKHNRSLQTLVVNGRYVLNSDVTYLMQNCYSDYLLTRQFPVWIIFIEIPKDMIDVNVHPSKMEVKFSDFSKVKKLLYSTITNILKSLSEMSNELYDAINNSSQKDLLQKREESELQRMSNFTSKDALSAEPRKIFNDGDKEREFTLGSNESKKVESLKNVRAGIKNSAIREDAVFSQILKKNMLAADYNQNENYSFVAATNSDEIKVGADATNKSEISERKDIQEELPIDNRFAIKILCKIFNTYILIEHKNDAYLIDQHAAHERIIFDSLLCSFNNARTSQTLLLPYIFQLSYNEGQFMEENLSVFHELGFTISKLSGNSFSVDSVPVSCTGINCYEFVKFFFDSCKNTSIRQSDLIKERAAKSACKAAVKGRDDLSIDEIDKLLKLLTKSDKLFCPHGRPVIIKLTKSEIEKWFKR